MSAVFILYLWTVVASDRLSTYADWRPIGEFQSIEACERAADYFLSRRAIDA